MTMALVFVPSPRLSSGATQGPHSMSALFDHLIKNQIKCINVKKMTKPN